MYVLRTSSTDGTDLAKSGFQYFFGTTHSILQVSYSKVKDKLEKRINEYMNREG